MVNGVLGKNGELALLPVVEEPVRKKESVTTLPHKTEEKAVILMDLMMKNPKVVIVELVRVHESFKLT